MDEATEMSIDRDNSAGQGMSDAAQARDLLDRLERHEAMRRRIPIADVRSAIGRKLNAAPGTLENIRRARRKTIPAWLMERLREALIAALHAEVAALEHEIQIHRQIGSAPDSDAVLLALAQVAKAKETLRGR